MDSTSSEDDELTIAVPLIPRPGIPTAINDTRKPYQKQLAVYIILASTLFERFAFFTLAANLTFNLESDNTQLHPLGPNTISYIFYGVSYLSAIIFAILSDWRFGRGKTIIFGFVIYLIGYMMGTFVTNGVFHSKCKNLTEALQNQTCTAEIYSIIFIISVGSGIVQTGMPVFGAEQIQESKITTNYFDKYAIVNNIGAILAVFIIRNRIVYRSKGDYGRSTIIATSNLFVATLLFLAGWKYYIHVPPYDAVLINCFPVIINAFQSWKQYKTNEQQIDRGRLNSMSSDTLGNSITKHRDTDEQLLSFLDFAKAVNNGKYPDRIVDDVKSLRTALIVFGLFIPFGLIHTQLTSTFAVQAKYMNQSFDHKNRQSFFADKVSLVWLGDPLIIIIGVITLNLFLYKYFHSRDRSFNITVRFVIGMFFAALSMCAAGTLEYFRQNGCNNNCSISNLAYNESSVSIYYQLPQNIFLGFGELFAVIASFDFAYFCSPRSGHSLFMTLRFCALGLSSFISVGYITLFSGYSNKLNFSCAPKENEPWHFYSYFYILGVIQIVFMIIFIICQRKFRIIRINPQQVETKQFIH